MLVQKELLSKLKDFGLNSYESKLWTALLSRGVSTAGELSDIANVPRSRSYDVLESLEKKGFIMVKIGKPIKYVAVPPEDVLSRVQKGIIESAEAQNRLLEEVRSSSILKELTSLHKSGITMVEPSDISSLVKGQKNIINHLADRISKAQNEIVIMTSSKGISRKIKGLKNALRKAHDRNVSIRIAAPLTQLDKEDLNMISKIADIRHTEEKGRFCLIDGKETTFMLIDDEKAHPDFDSAIWVQSDLFTNSLVNLFENNWNLLKKR